MTSFSYVAIRCVDNELESGGQSELSLRRLQCQLVCGEGKSIVGLERLNAALLLEKNAYEARFVDGDYFICGASVRNRTGRRT